MRITLRRFKQNPQSKTERLMDSLRSMTIISSGCGLINLVYFVAKRNGWVSSKAPFFYENFLHSAAVWFEVALTFGVLAGAIYLINRKKRNGFLFPKN